MSKLSMLPKRDKALCPTEPWHCAMERGTKPRRHRRDMQRAISCPNASEHESTTEPAMEPLAQQSLGTVPCGEAPCQGDIEETILGQFHVRAPGARQHDWASDAAPCSTELWHRAVERGTMPELRLLCFKVSFTHLIWNHHSYVSFMSLNTRAIRVFFLRGALGEWQYSVVVMILVLHAEVSRF